MGQIGECCRQIEEGIGDSFAASVALFYILDVSVRVTFGFKVVGRQGGLSGRGGNTGRGGLCVDVFRIRRS
jgi:hypothetical protein